MRASVLSVCAATVLSVSALAMGHGRHGPPPPALETFVRAQMAACDTFRLGQGGSSDRLFSPTTPLHVMRTVRRNVYRVRLNDRAEWTVDVDLTRQRIRSTRGANHPLPTPLDFCPGPIWEGPMHD
ncbi:MAG: hypothetical protein Q8Q09_07440 [Deltaproteobacteria bacterium]|nr:hypothetical protein [Deltaproteobacteria bacterium]